MSRATGWRDRAAGELLAKHARRLPPTGRALVMDDPGEEAARALVQRGLTVDRWWRRALDGRPATEWPEGGPFDLVALRLPKAKDELEMGTHAAASVLASGGTLVVYGAKDEGIGSAHRRIEPVLGRVSTLATGGHCRLLSALRPASVEGLRGSLADWREPVHLNPGPEGPALPDPWISYPGVFAHGRLDAGTRALLRCLPTPRPDDRVLDFGCGSGVLAAAVRSLAPTPEIEVAGLDVDAVALAAFRENVPGASTLLADGLAAVSDQAYTLIVANPPYHQGKAETLGVVEDFLNHAPRVLAPGGRLVMVVQQRLPVDDHLRTGFGRVSRLSADGTFQVWEAHRD